MQTRHALESPTHREHLLGEEPRRRADCLRRQYTRKEDLLEGCIGVPIRYLVTAGRLLTLAVPFPSLFCEDAWSNAHVTLFGNVWSLFTWGSDGL